MRARAVHLDGSLETNKDTNPFLHGVPAILEALRPVRSCRVYAKTRRVSFRHVKFEAVGWKALVG